MATRKKSTDQPTAEQPATEAPQPVRLRWIGREGVRMGPRTFGAYQWDKTNDYTQSVTEPDIALDLLTNGDFELVEDEN